VSLLAEHHDPGLANRAADRLEVAEIGIVRIDRAQRRRACLQPGNSV
jgi:hypothetical protein